MNNPLKYVDEDGEFWWIIAAAAIGGVINVISNHGNIHNIGDVFGYFGVGAVAGGVGAVTGGIGYGVGGAIGGALSGLVAGVSSGAILGGGNSLLTNGNFSHFGSDTFNGMLIGGASGAIIGGIAGGVTSYFKNENIWTGEANPTTIGPRQPQNPQPDAIPAKATPDAVTNPNTSTELLPNTSFEGSESIQTYDNFGQGFNSFREFKDAYGPAGSGYAWHHIVEQTPSNIAKFGPERIHNINNLIKLPHGAGSHHALITGFYSSKQAFTNGLTIRQWLSTKSFAEQYEFGINIIIMKW
jgi:hypothetical protein